MPSDTFSTGLGYLIMATGNDNNTWGVNANGSVFQIFEDAISGQLAVNTTGGLTDLSGSPPPAGPSAARYSLLYITGTLTANATIKVPALPKNWQVYNATAGAFSVLMTCAGGTNTITVPATKLIGVSCLGTNLVRSDFSEVGDYVQRAAAPAGFYGGGVLAANGAAISRTGYVDLFACLGTAYGAGDGSTTFNLPQVQDTGRYLRSYIPGTTTVGTTQANQATAHTHSFSATSGGESALHTHTYSGTSATENANHTHNYQTLAETTPGLGYGYQTGSLVTRYSGSNGVTTGVENQAHAHTYSGTSATESVAHNHAVSGTTGSGGAGTETRPETMIVWMGVRY